MFRPCDHMVRPSREVVVHDPDSRYFNGVKFISDIIAEVNFGQGNGYWWLDKMGKMKMKIWPQY